MINTEKHVPRTNRSKSIMNIYFTIQTLMYYAPHLHSRVFRLKCMKLSYNM